MKFTQHQFKVDLPVFEHMVQVVISNDIHEAYRRVQETLNISTDVSDDAAAFHMACGSLSFIFYPEKVTAGEIAHEAWHAVAYIFRRVGASLEEEMVAYHLEHLVDEITKRVARIQRRKNGTKR